MCYFYFKDNTSQKNNGINIDISEIADSVEADSRDNDINKIIISSTAEVNSGLSENLQLQ